MNRSIRTLVLAAPLATVALMAGTVSAQADPVGPMVLTLPGHVDPEPHPPVGPGNIAIPEPGPVGPQGPGDIAIPEPGPVDPGPQGPGDLTAPEPGPVDPGPQGPGDLTAPEQCPTHGVDCTPDDEPADSSDSSEADTDPAANAALDRDIPTPTRIDAGTPSEDGGLDTLWLLAGGAAVLALGAAGAGYRYLEHRA